ncbi:bifunctional hydroxymethylpyrimidine kinase/phosphomethylpyrimidine kinase [Agromyces larvae]|uniref:Thiamine-phosphate synthase n=1 Tax=Agromyces larvae TaxID=2929802 RepID=A0ABY4BUL9_9MICO|nr:bifunctional hydroxymethylpyrimidine kinase/phosphomethylpyrimidine kinase [Agromyces larvae]UOE42912.1 bifunctional hydroxymethylpyrimidine kinase/phosphomethylpyrimidine kinase [Agromyces larvae]
MSSRHPFDLSLTLVTDAALCGERGVAAVVAEAVAGGATIVQLRDKLASTEQLLEQVAELAGVIDGRAALVVNDRLDVVVAARERGIRVDGVHLGQSDAAVLAARDALGPDAIVGLTANTRAHLDAVARLPRGTVDYLGVGVIRPTSTKPDHPPALGVDGFAVLAAATDVPCVAIGGVGAADVPELRRAGAAGVAVVSAICAAPDPRAAAAEFAARWAASAGIEADGGSPTASGAPRPAGGVPRVLSIAGSDPSGGAGIQADLKSIAAVGGYGMAAITALTAQNTRGVRGVHVPPATFLADQLDTIADDIEVDAVKIGMLANAEVIDTVAAWLRRIRPPVVVLDPVMVATSGDRLLDPDAERALRDLLPLADLVTPNVAELAVLADAEPATTWAGVIAQAETVSAGFGVRVLAKGGHLDGATAPDALVDAAAATIVEFDGERIATTATHGTGCSLSSALATLRASLGAWEPAVAEARRWLRESLRHGESLAVGGGHGPVHHFAGLWSRGGLATAPTPAEVEAEWWAEIADVRRAIDELPFIRALADGSLPRTAFEEYLAQDAHYLRVYSRTLAEASRLAPDAPAQAFWAAGAQRCLDGELALHRDRLHDLRGPRDQRARPFEPNAANTAYLDHLVASGSRGGYAELIAAVLPCYWIYDDLGRRLVTGGFGPEALSPEHPYADWLAMYGEPAFELATRQAIDTVAAVASRATPAVRARMLRAFRRSAEHELAFFAAPWPADRIEVDA